MNDRNEIKKALIRKLEQSLQCMNEDYSEDIKKQLQTEAFAGELDKIVSIQGQGNNQVLGYFDVKINKFVTINMLSLVALLAEQLNQMLQKNQEYSSLSTWISLGVFVASLLNIIQPADTVKLEREDAEVYCIFLKLQRDRPNNIVITSEELKECISGMEEEIPLSKCLTHLKEKRLIKVVPDGFIVKREVKVECVL